MNKAVETRRKPGTNVVWLYLCLGLVSGVLLAISIVTVVLPWNGMRSVVPLVTVISVHVMLILTVFGIIRAQRGTDRPDEDY